MALVNAVERVPLKEDAGGVIRVGGTRVTLDSVIAAYHMGSAPEQILEQYPVLQLADIYAVISYYLRHRDEVDAYIAQNRQEAELARKEYEKEHSAQPSREQLLARRKSG